MLVTKTDRVAQLVHVLSDAHADRCVHLHVLPSSLSSDVRVTVVRRSIVGRQFEIIPIVTARRNESNARFRFPFANRFGDDRAFAARVFRTDHVRNSRVRPFVTSVLPNVRSTLRLRRHVFAKIDPTRTAFRLGQRSATFEIFRSQIRRMSGRNDRNTSDQRHA